MSKESNPFKVVIHAARLRALAYAAYLVTDEARLTFDPVTGLTVRHISPDNAMLVTVSFDPATFPEYTVHEPVAIDLSIFWLRRIVDTADARPVTITLIPDPSRKTVIFATSREEFRIQELMGRPTSRVPGTIPDLNLPYRCRIGTEDLLRALKIASQFDHTVSIRPEDGFLVFEVDDEVTGSIRCKVDVEAPGEVCSTFSLDLLREAAESLNRCTLFVQMELGNNHPVRVTALDGKIVYLQAPRVIFDD
jgi:hypothetical protein